MGVPDCGGDGADLWGQGHCVQHGGCPNFGAGGWLDDGTAGSFWAMRRSSGPTGSVGGKVIKGYGKNTGIKILVSGQDQGIYEIANSYTGVRHFGV